jgi:hypothetical protein
VLFYEAPEGRSRSWASEVGVGNVGVLRLWIGGRGPDPKTSQVFGPQESCKNNLDEYINHSKRAQREEMLDSRLLDPKGNRDASGLPSGLPFFNI